MVPARLPRQPPTLQQSKARARLPKAKTKTKPRRTRRRSKRKPSPCESLQQVLDDLPEDSPLRPDFEAQLQSLQGQLEDKRSKGARLDSAEARLRRAEASLAKKEQAMEDAAKALEEAKQEAEEAQKALEEVRASMVPNTVAEQPEEDETVLKLGLADVHDLHNLLHNLNPEHLMADPRLAYIERQNPSGGGLEALGADDEEAQVLGAPPFVHAHLHKIANLIGQGCLMQDTTFTGAPGSPRSGDAARLCPASTHAPSRILHLLRGQATDHTTESLTAQVRTTLHPLEPSTSTYYGRGARPS